MKIKLNTNQIGEIKREIRQTDRKNFDVDDVSQVFRMLQYWSKTVESGEEKIKSVAELPDGYLCRVNRTFRDSMKGFLKDVRSRRIAEEAKERKIRGTVDKYDRLIREAEEEKNRLGRGD